MKFNTSNIQKNTLFFQRPAIWGALVGVFVVTLFIYSGTAHAGIISYMNSLFGGEQVSAKISYFDDSFQTIALLQAVNAYDPNPEKPYGTIPIVGNAFVADIALADEYVADTSSTQISSYVVREGDTLSDIAKMFRVSVNTIMWANDINRASSLRVGQNLIILPVTGLNYTVKSGDTIRGIALKYKADLDEMLQYNDITLNSTLSIGQTIIIPDAEVQVSVPTKYVVKTNVAHDTNGPSYGSYYIRPLSSGSKSQGLHGYNAVDIAAPVGTPIYASASGKVISSATGGWNGGYGNLVIIAHNNGTQTLYAHNSKNLVTTGQIVKQGDTIALVGNTGKSTGSHLHFEIRGAKNPF